ncbi:DUF2269 domain-containing protein [Sinomonas sp. B1-1]|uniref:DUF2269 domain-containing protein n=1 Tax=Sinomonas sp. B1-1 TaxID=3141454 RepID=UPI003D271870
MPAGLRKAVLVAHITASVGWMGSVAAFFALAVAGLADGPPATVSALYVAMEPITWTVIVPLAFAALLTGLTSALASPWGLMRHWWVLFKLLLTAASTAVLMIHTQPIDRMAALAVLGPVPADELRTQVQLAVASGAALLVLAVVTVLSVYKPKGAINYRRPLRPGTGNAARTP